MYETERKFLIFYIAYSYKTRDETELKDDSSLLLSGNKSNFNRSKSNAYWSEISYKNATNYLRHTNIKAVSFLFRINVQDKGTKSSHQGQGVPWEDYIIFGNIIYNS